VSFSRAMQESRIPRSPFSSNLYRSNDMIAQTVNLSEILLVLVSLLIVGWLGWLG